MYKLLIIDDQQSILQMLNRRFVKLGYDVFTADNKGGALDILDNTPIDLVLLDYMMPQISGFDFYLSFRQKYDVPVIMITAHSSINLVIEFMRNGGTDFIEKPLDMDLLQLRINRAVKEWRLLKNQIAIKQISEKKLEKSNAALLEKTKKLEQKNRELDAFAAAVSHDLKAPINNIMGFVDLLKNRIPEETKDKEIETFFSFIENSINRMKLLISELLGFAKMQQIKKNIEYIDTQKLVEEVISTISLKEMNRPQFTFEALPFAQADLVLLRQVFYNLIHNATKYSKRNLKPNIDISATTTKKEITFAIKDNGVGFKTENSSLIFDIFTRLHSNEFEGIGIGLANVKRIVERHEGRIWAEGTEGEGATFYFTLPVIKK